ncbi:MAG: AbgT family transporter, partial [Oligoflexia bacterium]|nr:AbgT family transporter [Oligoflexia bacterium]
MSSDPSAPIPQGRLVALLARLERAGNKLFDPVFIFALGIPVTWLISAIFAQLTFSEIDPSTIRPDNPAGSPLKVVNLLTGPAFAAFLADMVKTFTGFHPLGVVLVALLGVGVADRSGLINALIRKMLGVTPKALLTPMLTVVALISHTGADAGYVLVIPLGGIIFA